MTTPAPADALDAEFQALARSRYGDDPRALGELGAKLVVGRDAPQSPADGAALIEVAAARDEPLALRRLAVLAAAGIGRTQSWRDAFEALRRAAELGDGDAIRERAVLAEAGVAGAAGIEAWLVPPPARTLHEAPRLTEFPALLPRCICAHLIAHAASRLVEAQVHDARSGGLKTDPMRTNTGAAYSLIDTDVVMQLARARIGAAVGIPPAQFEPLEILHYAVGERYRPHIDFFHPSLPGFQEEMRTKGQRIRTCLVYLNDDCEGGETDFPKIGVRYRGQPGDALVFENVRPNGAGDMLTLHEGRPPTRGEKWLLSQWIRNKQQAIA